MAKSKRYMASWLPKCFAKTWHLGALASKNIALALPFWQWIDGVSPTRLAFQEEFHWFKSRNYIGNRFSKAKGNTSTKMLGTPPSLHSFLHSLTSDGETLQIKLWALPSLVREDVIMDVNLNVSQAILKSKPIFLHRIAGCWELTKLPRVSP